MHPLEVMKKYHGPRIPRRLIYQWEESQGPLRWPTQCLRISFFQPPAASRKQIADDVQMAHYSESNNSKSVQIMGNHIKLWCVRQIIPRKYHKFPIHIREVVIRTIYLRSCVRSWFPIII